mgnify:CR=1 FL=1
MLSTSNFSPISLSFYDLLAKLKIKIMFHALRILPQASLRIFPSPRDSTGNIGSEFSQVPKPIYRERELGIFSSPTAYMEEAVRTVFLKLLEMTDPSDALLLFRGPLQ